MSVLEKAKAHFKGFGIKTIQVPEWDTTLYSKPVNVDETARFQKAIEADTAKGMIEVIIAKAMDKDGNKVFQKADAYELRFKTDPTVIDRVAGEILQAPTIEEQKGN